MEGNWLGLELVGAGLWCHGGCAARNLFRGMCARGRSVWRVLVLSPWRVSIDYCAVEDVV